MNGKKIVYWSSVATLAFAVLLSMLCVGAFLFGIFDLLERLF